MNLNEIEEDFSLYHREDNWRWVNWSKGKVIFDLTDWLERVSRNNIITYKFGYKIGNKVYNKW